ncbi:MaoC family dehydratase [Chachezhania sediminis]|uniref:MaoC family dehydratase n=1 Tax=Chachezhania sediminis TaxID=2599291 RepID=UPI00131B48D0|nr:MaoC family dehydratase [Chachezhania sediminis]
MAAIDDVLAASEPLIGKETGVTEWRTVDQTMIDTFAECTDDHQWIHVDVERAKKETPFGTTIAHGFLTLSLGSTMAYECATPMPGQLMSLNYGFDKVRFLNPVKSGSRVRGRFVLQSIKKRKPNEILRTNLFTVEIEGEETPALVAEWLGLTIFPPAE